MDSNLSGYGIVFRGSSFFFDLRVMSEIPNVTTKTGHLYQSGNFRRGLLLRVSCSLLRFFDMTLGCLEYTAYL